ncbi:MAG: hypothetical protein A3G25_00110 [Betaproteobacteria bacterium RIFCSPLOWO2_12_FULL_63_13]|nr:MAG: hypothetical protein A3G25_00110 [Betaproteobacteria bacterium RIFCSPLOWO2_12_FULL_63_13]
MKEDFVDESYQDVIAVFEPKQTHEGGAVLLQFQTGDVDPLRISMKPQIARYLASQLQLRLLLPASAIGGPADEPYQDTVDVVPPDKSPDGETVLLKFQIANDEMVRLRMSIDLAREFGTQLLLLSATSGNR